MKTIIRFAVTATLIILGGGTLYSQFKISGEVRPRMEYRHGFSTLPDSAADNAFSVDQRTRLTFELQKEKIAFKVSLQDVRTWGSQIQLVGNESNATSIHEAWGLAKINDYWSFKFGRQEMVYDDHRILGNVDWAQQARSHDAFLFLFEKEKFKIHFGGAYNQDGPSLNTTSYTVGKSYKTMQFAWSNIKFNDDINLSLLAMGLGQQVNYINTVGANAHQDNYTLTTGTRFVMQKSDFGLAANAYYQLGSTNSFPARNVSAYNFALELSYKFSDAIKLSLGFEMLSGNSQTDTTTAYGNVEHAFNPYFGTNHKFNGYMDYFYVGNHVGNVGLNDIYLSFDYTHKKFSAGITGHGFLANAKVLDVPWLSDPANTTGEIRAMSSYLGAEIDVFGGFKIVEGVAVKLGYSHMLGTSTMEAIKGGDKDEISNWGWLMVVLKPTLFEQKPETKQ